jgi:hypothetical protein
VKPQAQVFLDHFNLHSLVVGADQLAVGAWLVPLITLSLHAQTAVVGDVDHAAALYRELERLEMLQSYGETHDVDH